MAGEDRAGEDRAGEDMAGLWVRLTEHIRSQKIWTQNSTKTVKFTKQKVTKRDKINREENQSNLQLLLSTRYI